MGTRTERAREYRKVIDSAGMMLTDEQAAAVPSLYGEWAESIAYIVGERRNYNGILYTCLLAHTSQKAWTPDKALSLWAKVLIPDPGVIPEWEQPDSTNPYMAGDKVMYQGQIWVSIVDNNVWKPGEYGWEVYIEEDDRTYSGLLTEDE